MTKIIELLAKSRRQIILVVTCLLALLSVVNFYFIFNITAQSNDECLWLPTGNDEGKLELIFSLVKVDGVSWEAGIRDGDQLVAINGEILETINQATLLLDGIDSGEYAVYTVKRGEYTFDTEVRVKKLINFPGLGIVLLGFIWLVVGFIVVMAKSNGQTQRLFYEIGVAAILMSLFYMFTRGTAETNPVIRYQWLLTTVDILWTIGASYFPFLLIRFFLQFPRSYKILDNKKFLGFLKYGPIWVFIFSLSFRILFTFGNNFRFYGIVLFYHFSQVILAAIISVIILAVSYIKIKDKKERKPVLIILLSAIFGVAALLFTIMFANVLADTIFNSPQYFMPIIFVAVIPVAFGFSIFKYSLMDVSDVVKNAIIYFSATVTLAGSYFLVVYTIGQSLSDVIGTDYRSVIAGGIFIIFAMVFQSTKDRFQNLLTKRFYPEQFAFHKVMMQFSNDIASIVGLENILDSTHKTFLDALKLDRFGIALFDENFDDYKLRRQTGLEIDTFVIKEESEHIREFIEKKKVLSQLPVIERSDFHNLFINDCQKLVEAEIYTVIPIIMKSKVIGLLLFGLKYSGSQFAGKDLELLVAAANQTAVSIENARLYESEAEKLKLEQDLNNARKIQESLLPKDIPNFEGAEVCGRMIPATYVGGDYFDIIKISPKKFFVVIGDVSGKGLSASFYMSKLQTMISLYSTDGKSPKDILQDINKKMYESIEKNWFITVSLGLFDLEKEKLNFCRAGHTPLLLSEDSKIIRYQSQGIGVGLEKGDKFNSSLEMITINVKPEQQFIFYSDGITEMMNGDNELFGEERLEDILLSSKNGKAAETMNNILNDLNKFRGKTPQYDDVTIVVVNIK